ncbi:MAG: polyprenyl synthetase family protein [Planctomycetes bacterium]|nr:polyprenyl synthetase family protein [Planctomycetota bacterium]
MKSRQSRIDAALKSHLETLTRDAPEPLRNAMAYSLLAPGKRLRPLLTLLACEAAGGTAQQALPSAVAIEMVHTYSLIHDDLPAMDDDDLRRGMPTCHKKYGEALAILAGDALLTLAFQVVAGVNGSRTAAVSCLTIAEGAGAVGMVGGQTLDLIADGRIQDPSPTPPLNGEGQNQTPPSFVGKGVGGLGSLENIHARKTGALFRASLRLGVYAAQADRPEGVNAKTLAAADRYAATFGLLFQVTDDLLDVESTADKTGKRVGKDAARGKLTYPGLLGVEESRRKAAELGTQAVTAAEELGSPLLASLAQYVVTRER